MQRLVLDIQDYNWGKAGQESEVAKLLVASGQWREEEIEGDRHYAELWVGTHSKTPSRLESGQLLESYIQEHPDELGEELVSHFGVCLPFLTKVLSIGHPLQLQVHPSMEEARKLHRESPTAFLDGNHKPEMAVALTPFTALCGWRDPGTILQMAEKVPEFGDALGKQVLELLKCPGREEEQVAACYTAIFQPQTQEGGAALLASLAKRLGKEKEEETDEEEIGKGCATSLAKMQLLEALDVFLELHTSFPGDRGCWGVFLLNLLRLAPGEAIWVPAGQIHAYVSGDCVEVLSCGDNVLFCGLVHDEDVKHFPPQLTDPDILAQVVSFKPSPSPLVPEGRDEEGHSTLSPPVREFSLTKIEVSPLSWLSQLPSLSCASTLLVIQGQGSFQCGEAILPFCTGQAFFLPCSSPLTVSATTTALIYRVTIGSSISTDM